MSRPVICTEDTAGHVTGFIQPDHEFWRYLFAGLAMQGMIASRAEGWPKGAERAMARWSVTMTDALLAELEEGKEGGDG